VVVAQAQVPALLVSKVLQDFLMEKNVADVGFLMDRARNAVLALVVVVLVLVLALVVIHQFQVK
jgi:hypothetical protein